MKGKQLRKAVLLGMAMSMAVWTTGMAQEPITNDFTYNEAESITVTNTEEEQAAIQVADKTVSIQPTGEGSTIKLESAGSGIRTEGGSDGSTVTLTSAGNNEILFNKGTNKKGDGITVEDNSHVTVTAENGQNYIHAENYGVIVEDIPGGDGIRIQGDGTATVTGQINKIEVIDDGLYIHQDSGDTANITLTATGSDAEGIGNYIDGNNGIHTDSENKGNITVTANGGKNVIHGTQNAVYNSGFGTINIIASGNSTGEGISLLADYIKYDNFLTAGENGVKSDGTGETNVIADNDNIIAGTTNGILSNDSGTINVTAGNNNIIGQYKDESGNTVTSENGINVTAGTVNITTENGINKIFAGAQGILTDGNNAVAKLLGNTHEILVTGDQDAVNTDGAIGIYTKNNSSVIAPETQVYENFTINVTGADVQDAKGTATGIRLNTNSNISLYGKNLNIYTNGLSANGIDAYENSSVNLNNTGTVYIESIGKKASHGIRVQNSTLDLNAKSLTIISNSEKQSATGIYNYPEVAENYLNIDTKELIDIDVISTKGSFGIRTAGVGSDIHSGTDINVSVIGGDGDISAYNTSGINSKLKAEGNIILSMQSVNGIDSSRMKAGVFADNQNGEEYKQAIIEGKNVSISAESTDATGIYGLYNAYWEDSNVNDSAGNTVNITANGAGDDGIVNLKASANKSWSEGIHTEFSETNINAKNIFVKATSETGEAYGIYANHYSDEGTNIDNESDVNLHATETNQVYGTQYGILAKAGNNVVVTDEDAKTNVVLTADMGDNIVGAGTIDGNGFGSGVAVNVLSGAHTNFTAKSGRNFHHGAIDTRNDGSNVKLDGLANIVKSAAIIDAAGDLNEDKNTDPETTFKDRKVISSLYAEDNANITVSGDWNEFRTYADDPADDTTLERTIWAYEGANIEINGSTLISTDRYAVTSALQPHNSADIAIAAGTAVNLEDKDFDTTIEDGERAKVTLNYGAGSSITGDVLSAYAGKVDITPQESTTRSNSAGISITGNLLAGNNGILNVNLGNGGTLTGRTDDYGDANDTIVNDEHIKFFNPAFSSTIYRGGEVNLTMGSGSYWDVTGQSWLTRLDGNGGTIDMRNSENEKTTSHAVHVDTIKGNHTFVMDLNHDNHNVSDMLYIKDPNDSAGEQTVFINRLTGVEDMADGKKLRFATVNASTDKLSFVGQYEGENGYGNKARVMMRDIGVMDMALTIENEKYTTTDTENTGYNGTDFTETKPGDEYVDETYTNGTNWYLTRTSSGDTTSDAGKTVVAMSRINYSNAIYMDRLNKRMGEARYIDGDEGLWVRMRHDRIGKSDAFRSMNTMMELGYDTRVNDREDGEHRQGVAIDYMRGTADYKNVAGEGDVRRGGIWFYDTWLGNKGHYTDYVLKFGRLSNDFELYTRTLGEKVTGDYSNFVYSASAEYGRKKDLGNNWYIEPQAQIQYAHVTDADYTTSQDTHVQLDAIDSLIGRVGFRLGKDVGEKSTFYIKADVLHEFLGDQDIEARDATGLLSTTYENEGTWYDIGLGFSHQFSKGTYMYLDMEKSIGNDNEDTYQFNFGMNWKV